MPRAYVTGLKLRPGDKAGDPCEVPGCVRVTSSTWHYRGTCCSKRGCRMLGATLATKNHYATEQETSYIGDSEQDTLTEDLAQRVNVSFDATAEFANASDAVKESEVVAAARMANHREEIIRWQARAHDAEDRVAAMRAQLVRVLRTIVSDVFRDDDGCMEVPGRRIHRRTGLLAHELHEYHVAIGVLMLPRHDVEASTYVRDE